jgi:hypothetical protein
MHTNWNNKLNNPNNSLDQITKDVIDTIHELTDKHASIKKVPRSKAKQFSKPWITSDGILKSIKTKQKMYRIVIYTVAQTRHHKIHFAFPCFRIFNFCISMFPHFQLLHFHVSAFSYFHVSVFSYFRIFVFSCIHILYTVVIFIQYFLRNSSIVIVYIGTGCTLFRQYTTATLLKVDLVTNYIFFSFYPSITLLNSFKLICLHVN